MLKSVGILLFSYLLGSIPWGLVLTRIFTSVDIRRQGSGNIGATNVKRVAGPTLGALTLAGDVLKGAFPVWLAMRTTSLDGFWGAIFISLVTLSAFFGHLYPVFLKFKDGGKGVATAGGCFFVISPVAGIVVILVFIMFACWSNRVSAASLGAAAALPIAVWKASGSSVITGCAFITAVFIYIRHRDNIKRLVAGTEPGIWS